MKMTHGFNSARLIFLALLVAPISTWASDCEPADRHCNRSQNPGPIVQFPSILADGCRQAHYLCNRSRNAGYQQKIRLLIQALEKCEHVCALTLLANIRENEGKWSEAKGLYCRAIQADSNCASAYAGLGEVFMEQQDYQRAAAAFKKCHTVRQGGTWYCSHDARDCTERLKKISRTDSKKVLVNLCGSRVVIEGVITPFEYLVNNQDEYHLVFVENINNLEKHLVIPPTDIFASTNGLESEKAGVSLKHFATLADKTTDPKRQRCKKQATAIQSSLKSLNVEKARIRIDRYTGNVGTMTYKPKLPQLQPELLRPDLLKNQPQLPPEIRKTPPKLPSEPIRIDGPPDHEEIITYDPKLPQIRHELLRPDILKKLNIQSFQVPANRLEVVGWGEESATTQTKPGEAANRCVTIIRINK